MLKMIKEDEEPPSTNVSPVINGDTVKQSKSTLKSNNGFLGAVTSLFKAKPDSTLRETIEEYFDDDCSTIEETSISVHEKTLISNVLDLRDMCAFDVMVPRADIVALDVDSSHEQSLQLFSEKQFSRVPVYKETLDHIVGTIHVKDVLGALARGENIEVKSLVRDVPIVSPSMQILDLLLQMRITQKHMVMVVDEFGGIDGLITIGDVIESIVGEIDDEHDIAMQPEIIIQGDGLIVADARVDLEEFEEQFGALLSDEEKEEAETLGGLVFYIAGRVPSRGEVIRHDSGLSFEIIEADPRRVKRLYIHRPSERSSHSAE
ncbi:MAG: CBS domain-containing protein [Alphaproteobacteria bacterium]|nr:CBS domain-containing protein [Alphaproteobacteria bacterium]